MLIIRGSIDSGAMAAGRVEKGMWCGEGRCSDVVAGWGIRSRSSELRKDKWLVLLFSHTLIR
jgi:hypothetical protein